MTEALEKVIPYSHEVLNIIDGFAGDFSRIMAARYDLQPEAYGTINDILQRYKDAKPFDPDLRKICDDLKKPLSRLVGPDVFIDAEPNRFYGSLEVEISKQRKKGARAILSREHELLGHIRPGRGSREDMLVLGPGRLMYKTPGLEVDCYDSTADRLKVPGGILEILTTESKYGIPYGKLSIVAEEQGLHRDHVRISASEDYGEPRRQQQMPLAVAGAKDLGVEAYYDVHGHFKSLGIYFHENGRWVFGTSLAGIESYKFVGRKSDDNDKPSDLPAINIGGSKITIERHGVSFEFDKEFDYRQVIGRFIKVLRGENNPVDIQIR